MDAGLADHLRAAGVTARRHALAFRAPAGKDALPWSVIEAFDAKIRGHVERDPRIEDERDRVLIAAVKLAETPVEEGEDTIAAARAHLIGAIDYLEQAVMRFGRVNRQGAKLGYGSYGQPVGSPD
ncbi:hypothetical protein SAMN05216360_11537 [Methylobacterium phyllostachyos]|uniref:Uncharacterized protein n=1 Tax=Methylobacterium phyllostachyos TaxID=582672 RepID=A0A1H0H141_9HYPH|nr:hypothetical protein [Methylobacterium phyllostachyos]SDO12820.1 hypothetical protein SAMN05216360_11537 [Methylobacterium phyllostachyos]